jgi:hypothetical protein
MLPPGTIEANFSTRSNEDAATLSRIAMESKAYWGLRRGVYGIVRG